MKLEIDFPPDFNVRYGYDKPEATGIGRMIAGRDAHYRAFIDLMAKYRSNFSDIALNKPDDADRPFWKNGMFPPVDGMALYTFLAERNPKTLIEIGSGNSTKYARKSIADHGLRTKIISIDPKPRAVIDQISDVIVRQPLETVDLSVFNDVEPNDMVFFDGSHRCFQNSDVTAFFIDVLPGLPEKTLVGIHDVFWPSDYPPHWRDRLYNEQYMLAAYMLGAADRFTVEFPCFYATHRYQDDLFALVPAAVFENEPRWVNGVAFWFQAPPAPIK